MTLSEKARTLAKTWHEDTNHTYDGKPYEYHLNMVVENVYRYASLVDDLEVALAAAWLHDVIEDCRITYNDVKITLSSSDVADIVYALTNEKGKNRAERANARYYEGIRNTPMASFVKICDRLANVLHSVKSGTMTNVYLKEHDKFKSELYDEKYKVMFDELERLLALKDWQFKKHGNN